MEMKKFIACGRQIGGDVARVRNLGVNVPQQLELGQVAAALDSSKGRSLQELLRRFCHVKLKNKHFGQDADYEVDELPDSLIQYAADDWIEQEGAYTDHLHSYFRRKILIDGFFTKLASTNIGMQIYPNYSMWTTFLNRQQPNNQISTKSHHQDL